MKKYTFFLPLVGAILVGCMSNGFEKFYQPASGSQQVIGSPNVLPPPPEPSAYVYSADIQADLKRLSEDGYALIGTSSFSGPESRVKLSQAIAQGKKVGAALVMVKSQYLETVSGVRSFTLPGAPQTATVNTTGTVNAYGSGGYATGNYNAQSTVTMPGAPVTYTLPYSVRRDEFFASYWVKINPKKMHLGIRPMPIPDAMRQKLERNTGVYVYAVVRGTPAFRTNILDGDLITKIDDEDVIDPDDLNTQLARNAGRLVKLTIIRNGEQRVISVALNP